MGPRHGRETTSAKVFLAFATNKTPPHLAGVSHRTAALEDSRLIPLVELTP